MAVQIPEVQRQGPIGPESQTPLEMKVVDGSQQFAEKANALVSAGDKIQSSYDTALHQGAEVTALNVGNQLDAFKRGKLSEAKKWEGDPTEKFAQIDKEVESFKGELLAKYKDAPDVTQKMVNNKLSEVDARTNIEKLTQLGIQHEAYKQKVVNATTDNNKHALMGMAEAYNPQDKHSKELFDAALNNVSSAIKFEGETHGLVEKNPDGTYKSVSPILVDQMRKEESDGLRRVIQMFNETGQVEKSKALLDDYKERLTPKDLDIVLRGQKEAGLDTEALKFLPKVANLPIAQARAAAAKQFPDNVLQQERVIQKLETYKAQNEKDLKYNQDMSFNGATRYLNKLQESGNSPVTKEALWSDPMMKNFKDNLSLEQQQKIERSVFKPTVSDPKQIEHINELMASGDFEKLSPQQLQQTLAGLSQSDYRKNNGLWQKANDPSQSHTYQQYNFISEKILKPMLLDQNIIELDPRTGKLKADSILKKNEFDSALQTYLANNKIPNNLEEQQKAAAFIMSKGKGGIQDMVRDGSIKQQVKPFVASPSATPAPEDEAKKESDAKSIVNKLTLDQQVQAMKWWQETYKQPFSKTPNHTFSQLKELYDSKVKGK